MGEIVFYPSPLVWGAAFIVAKWENLCPTSTKRENSTQMLIIPSSFYCN